MDFTPEIDELQGYIEDTLWVGAYDGRKFVPKPALRKYMDSKKIKNFLQLYRIPLHKCESIRTDYLAVFVILLLMRKGNLITYFLEYEQYSDARLPFEKAADLPKRCDQDFYDDFDSVQWAYCARTLGPDSLADKRYNQKMIIPITSRDELKRGPDGITYKVEIHPAYDQLSPECSTPRFYVLKTWAGGKDEFYENEVSVYRTLWQQDAISKNIARFYGSWRHGSIYNILLEFVEGGTLTALFEEYHPISERELLQLWTHAIDLLLPICRLHCRKDPDHPNWVVGGVHQDIKPDNILLSLAHPSSPFGFDFKLADMGLAYAPPTGDHDQVVRGRDRPSTQMFAAPECYRDEYDTFDLSTSREVSSPKDIWSLGCVFSELVVWSVLGRSGRADYLELRRNATNHLKNTASYGCFHDRSNVSTAVQTMHTRVLKRRHIIVELVRVIEKMLTANPNDRPDALTTRRLFKEALQNAQRMLPEDETDYPSILQVEADDVSNGSPLPSVISSPSPPRRAHTFAEPTLASSRTFKKQPGQPRLDERSEALTPHSIRNCHPPQSAPTLEQRSFKRSATDHVAGSSYTGLAMPPRSPARQGQSLLATINSPIPERVTHQSSNQVNDISSIPNVSSSMEGNTTNASHPNAPSTNNQPHNSEPYATVADVLKWIQAKKKDKKSSKGFASPIAEAWLRMLRGKDQIFVIDNSSSMQPHRPQVRDTFVALAYLVKGLDPDGIDIYFTMSGTMGHEKHTSKLLALFDEVQFDGGQGSMEFTLSNILEGDKKKRWSLPSLKTSPHKGKMVYVLTDGKWHGTHDLDGMPELIKRQVEKIGSRDKLAIQFIQFGDDSLGTWRLEELDDRLDDHGVEIDIIDTVRHSGNVYKMLLGHLITSWDRVNAATDPGPLTRPETLN